MSFQPVNIWSTFSSGNFFFVFFCLLNKLLKLFQTHYDSILFYFKKQIQRYEHEIGHDNLNELEVPAELVAKFDELQQ